MVYYRRNILPFFCRFVNNLSTVKCPRSWTFGIFLNGFFLDFIALFDYNIYATHTT